MTDQPFISICIPAYKRIDDLKRLLNSISQQTFKNFEVIVSDDSPDDSVEQLCTAYTTSLNLIYYNNTPALGTPENWNAAIRKANGTWIKLMHDDDYFASDESLQIYVDAAKSFPETKLFYSAFV